MNLIAELQDIAGAAHVLTGEETQKYGTDWTKNYVAEPLAVLRPANTAEVSEIVKRCAAAGTPIVPVSGNTGLAGGTYAAGSVMISLERMNTIREIRPDARIAVVDAGVILSNIHDAVAEHDLVFPLTLGARGTALIGGCLSTNAGGSNVVRYGSTRGLCLGLEVVLPDGRIMDLMSELHKDNSGYDLKDLMIGAEGTLGLITGAVLRLFPKPISYATAMVAMPNLDAALDLLHRLQETTGGAVEAFEYMPRQYIVDHMSLFPEARAPFEEMHEVNIMVEIGATDPRDGAVQSDGSTPVISNLESILGEMMEDGHVLDAVVAQSETQRAEMWDRREAAGVVSLTPLPVILHDLCVPVDKVAEFERRVDQRLAELDPKASSVSVTHLGDGNVHYTIRPSNSDKDHADRLTEAVEDVTLDLGGSFSAEHGVGLSKLNSMSRRKDPVALDVMRAIKSALDPKNIMNPGKVVP